MISVIIPVYKVEECLNRCVDSILNQTYKNIEIILVDDGSPDKCGKICDRYAAKDNRIQVLHKENGGLSSARNAGIEIANGEYYTFLDSDDWVDNRYIEKLYTLIKETESDISVCNFEKVYSEDTKLENSKIEIYEFTNIEALEQLTGRFYIQLVTAWGKLYHRSLFKDIRYPVCKIHEDEYIAHHLYYKANKIVMTTEKLLYYWQREDSITGIGFNLRNKIYAGRAFKERAEFLDKLGLYGPRDRAYRSTFINYRQIYEHIDEVENKEEILKEFLDLKSNLRKGKYDSKFKIAYELYYMFPRLMKRILDFYVNRIKDIK